MIRAGIGNIHGLDPRIQNTDARTIKATEYGAAGAGAVGRAAHAGLPSEHGTQGAATLTGDFPGSQYIDRRSVILDRTQVGTCGDDVIVQLIHRLCGRLCVHHVGKAQCSACKYTAFK